MRGRKPKPTVLRILQGNPSRRKFNEDEPETEPIGKGCPRELEDDEVARAEWERTIVPAIDHGQITGADRAHAIGYCRLWATWRKAVVEVNGAPLVIAAGVNHYPMPNPAYSVEQKTFQALSKCAVELGLTPSSRTRIKVGPSGQRITAVDKFKAQKKA